MHVTLSLGTCNSKYCLRNTQCITILSPPQQSSVKTVEVEKEWFIPQLLHFTSDCILGFRCLWNSGLVCKDAVN